MLLGRILCRVLLVELQFEGPSHFGQHGGFPERGVTVDRPARQGPISAVHVVPHLGQDLASGHPHRRGGQRRKLAVKVAAFLVVGGLGT